MSFNNTNINLNDEYPVLPDLIPLESIDLVPPYLDITTLNDGITSLSIELNTQSLRIEIEKTKRQKLNMMIKRNRHERMPSDSLITGLRNDINILTEQLGTMRNTYESEMARIGFTTYRCFARLHKILIATIPGISMPEAENQDVSQLPHEPLRNIEQLRSPFDPSLSTIV